MAGTQMGPVVVFGGSGFVGRHIVRRLAKDGFKLRVFMRRPNEALFLKTAGRTGQIELVEQQLAVVNGGRLLVVQACFGQAV